MGGLLIIVLRLFVVAASKNPGSEIQRTQVVSKVLSIISAQAIKTGALSKNIEETD
jgi:hypothetical protein